MKSVIVNDIEISNDKPLTLIAGPCSMESEEHALKMSKALKAITSDVGMPFIYKTSFDKANRTSVNSKRGIGLDQAIDIFHKIKEEVGCSLLTDVHTPEQCMKMKGVVDVIQIPAFLCRQTDLLLAAGESGLVVNVKKGQFLAPWDMKNVAAKIASTGNENILLTDRGTSFGYNTLVSDFRCIPIMKETGYPVVFDATHSVQQPGGQGETSGGERKYVPVLAKAAVAIGIAALFIETHDDPDNAWSDGPNQMYLDDVGGGFLSHVFKLDRLAKEILNPS